jgi:hypothetical protein
LTQNFVISFFLFGGKKVGNDLLGWEGKHIYWLCGSRRYRALHANITLSHIYTLHLASICVLVYNDGMMARRPPKLVVQLNEMLTDQWWW